MDQGKHPSDRSRVFQIVPNCQPCMFFLAKNDYRRNEIVQNRHGSMIALNCNKDIPEADFEKEMGVKAGECYHCHTGRCPVGVATQDPKLRARLNPDDAALRVYNYLHSMTLEAQLLARACGKTNIHSLEPEDLAALTSEASALAKVPLAGTNYTVGVDNFHKI